MKAIGLDNIRRSMSACAAAILLAGCSSSGVITESNWPRERTTISGYDLTETGRVLSYGLTQIQAKAIDQPDLTSLVLDGLRGLSKIEPSMSVVETEDRVVTYVVDEVVSDLAKPEDKEVAAWLSLFQGSVVGTRAQSDILANADNEEIYSAFFNAALENLDPYSRYAGRLQARSNREVRNGFGGLGLTYVANDVGLEVRGVQPGTPAIAAGLRPGDLITHVDGQTVATKRSWTIRRLLRGSVGSKSDLVVIRGRLGEAQRVQIERSLIVPQTVEATVEDDVAVVTIHSFNQRTSKTVESEITRLRNSTPNLKGVILDLRGDPGGLLDQAVAVSDLFMNAGQIVSTRGRHPESIQKYNAFDGDLATDLPVAVLVDSRSASAAEIVAAALQDTGRAIVIGTSTYGKGTVQTVIRLPNDGEITLTWSRFHAPDGYAIEDLGVLPMVCTSGTNEDPARLLESWQSQSSQFAPQRSDWRTISSTDMAGRSTLREACPAQVRDTDTIDLDVAKNLILNDILYAQAIGLTAVTAAQNATPD